MKPKRPIHRLRGFTLVELLVVIAIIIVLAGLSLGGVKLAQKRARMVEAKNVCTQIDQAIVSFYDDYNYLPSSGTAPTSDTPAPGAQTIASEGIAIVQTLLGSDQGDAATQNPKGIAYVKLNEIRDGKKGKSGVNINSISGIPQNALIDPWSRTFYVMLDYNYDKVMEDPVSTGNQIRGRLSATYTLGEPVNNPNDKTGYVLTW